MSRPLRVLLIEDSPDDAELLRHELQRGGFAPEIECVDTSEALQAQLCGRDDWAVVIADYAMPHFSGRAALHIVQAHDADLPFIVISGTIRQEVAVDMLRSGAHDYVLKDNLARLVPAIERELRNAANRREQRSAQAAIREEGIVAAALARVGHQLIAALSGGQPLDRLCALTAEALDMDLSCILIRRADAPVYHAAAAYGLSAPELEAARVVGLPEAMLADLLVPLQHDDVARLDVREEHVSARPQWKRWGGRPRLGMALRRGEALIGILTATSRASSAPCSRLQVRIARGIAQLASLSLENSRLIEALERASRLKSDFVATMSHELRTPINVIIGYTDILREAGFGPLTAEQADALERIDRSTRQLLGVINATLDISRLESGRTPVDYATTDLRALIGELAADIEELQQEKPAVALRVELAPDLPLLLTDPVKLKVVLRNLLHNALKFTEQGSVTLRAAPSAAGVDLSVADTGIGIAAETLPIIFESFRQGDASTTRRHGGVGLGLYIVQQLLDLLGGTIAVDTQLGHGSTFRISLPLRPSPSAASAVTDT